MIETKIDSVKPAEAAQNKESFGTLSLSQLPLSSLLTITI